MTLFGKLLLVFNLLAGGAFVYFATQDWKGRQSITAAGLRHILVLQGIPLDGPDTFKDDSTEFRVSGPGGVPTTTVNKKLLDAYFQPTGAGGDNPNSLAVGTAVPNQVAELRRVKTRVEEILGKAESDAARLALLRGYLQYQVETFAERVEILALAATDRLDAAGRATSKTAEEIKSDADELQKRLIARFDALLEAPKAPEAAVTTRLTDADFADADSEAKKAAIARERLAKITASRAGALDEGERRARVAHLLVHLSPDAAWQKRVLAVVGARRYVGTVGLQARRFKEMSQEVEQLLVADQEGYFEQLNGRPEQRGLLQNAEDQTKLANRQFAIRAKWINQALKDGDINEQRKTQLTELTTQLTKIKNEVDAMLARQSSIETGLFEIQREVALTLDEVYRNELEIAALERKLAGGGK